MTERGRSSPRGGGTPNPAAQVGAPASFTRARLGSLAHASQGWARPGLERADLKRFAKDEAAAGARTRGALEIPAATLWELEAWVRDGYPLETCGLLVGNAREGRTEVVKATRARNLERARAMDRYRLDPEDQLAAEMLARASGRSVVGVWHSHPDHPARPSETDRDGAWEGYSYLILAVTAKGVEDARSWRLEGGDFVEEELRS